MSIILFRSGKIALYSFAIRKSNRAENSGGPGTMNSRRPLKTTKVCPKCFNKFESRRRVRNTLRYIQMVMGGGWITCCKSTAT